jgi:hypothetical protein
VTPIEVHQIDQPKYNSILFASFDPIVGVPARSLGFLSSVSPDGFADIHVSFKGADSE